MNFVKSLFSTYLAHLSAYVGHAVTIFAAVDPTGLPPVVRLAIGVAGLVTTAGHNGYAAGVAGKAVSAAVSAAAQVIRPAALVLAMILLVPMLHGCAQLSGFITSPSSAPIVDAGVLVAVATAEAKGFTPAQINAIAHKALDADQGASATLAAVSGVVQSQIAALKLPAADQAAADILVAALSAAIQTKVGDNATLAQAQTAAAVVITDVIKATGG